MSHARRPVLVAGFHRSGTSLTAHSLVRAGLHVGEDLLGAGPSNPDGHFESRAIVRFHDRLLAARGGAWDRVPAGLDRFAPDELAEARALAGTLGGGAPGHWGFKDPRLCLFLPLWEGTLDDPLIVVVYRDPIACANSLLRREAQSLVHQPVHRERLLPFWSDPARALDLWCDYNERLLDAVRARPASAVVMSFAAIVAGAQPGEALARRCGARFASAAVPVADDAAGRAERVEPSLVSASLLGRDRLRRARTTLDALDALADGATERRAAVPERFDVEAGAAARDAAGVRAGLAALGIDARPPTAGGATRAGPASDAPSTPAPSATPAERARNAAAASDAAPEDVGLALQAGQARLAAGERDAARASFERSHAGCAHGHAASLHLGLMARDDGDAEAALAHFETALRRAPGHAGLQAHASTALVALGRDDEAFATARTGLAREPDHEWLAEIAVAAATRLGRHDEAAAALDAATGARPGSPRLAMLRYELVVARGERSEREAQPLLRRALALRLRAIDGAGPALVRAVRGVPGPEARHALAVAASEELERLAASLCAADARAAARVAPTARTRSGPVPDERAGTRLAMSILVRDERDVIEANVRFHAARGVDRFVITDNGSVDGTRERLAELATTFDIEIIDEPGRTIDQDRWVTRMAERVRERGDADWLIHNDADEFWCPADGNLKAALLADVRAAGGDAIGVLHVPRRNFVATREQARTPDLPFDAVDHGVLRTVALGEGARRWHDVDAHILLRTLPGKVITRMDGLESVDMGNHGARHALGEANASGILIHHYPVRGYEQFRTKVRNYGESLAANTRFGPRVSRHLRYWYERLLAGELHEEFLDMHPDAAGFAALVDSGHVVVDGRLAGRLTSRQTGRTDRDRDPDETLGRDRAA